ncbi:uncharacterized protein [Heterodontus francisci]|uniref:uncharacterized protein n=1 Tax=Heterodontus francisci TaxID=7792 RepID=UPI00355B3239
MFSIITVFFSLCVAGPKPKCYNVNDPVLNSTAWFAQYLGFYLSQMSLTDLQSFSDNETLLQEFAENQENLALLENISFMNEVATVYINFLVEHNPNFNASSLPNSLVCFITDTNLLQSLTAQQILSVTRKINQVCGLNVLPNTTGNGTSPAEGPTDEQLKLSIAIVSKIENFSVSTLNTLGQTAVGLSVSQVGNIDGDTVQKALPSLSKVRGWNVGQANAIVVKLLRNGLQVNNAQNLLGLGSLVSGIPSGVFQSIDPRVFIRLISNSTFVENIGAASQPLQLIYVLQVLRNVNDPLATVKNIPPVLAKEIPPIMLNSNLSLNDVNNKQWVPSQAAVFFENVVRNSNNFKKFSPSVLQGFSCGAVKTLNSTTFLQLVQSMKGKGVVLDESQLECMSARLNSDGASLAIDTFPVDVLLFFSSAQFRRSDNCQTYFKLVGKSNIDILRKGSARRQNLFNDARTCLEISGRNLTKESVTILGRLVCDLDESIITESDISILDALKYCTSYREDQKKAIELRLNSLSSKYGDPSSWSSSTIKDLGNLALTLNGTWQQVNRDVLNEALPRFIKELKRLRPPSDVLIFINQLNLRRRSNNTANCTEAPIAAEDINDLTPAVYNAAQLDLCLRDLVLKDNVLQLGSLAFDPTQLKVLKKRLLQIYPGGLPENQIQLLGNISTVFNVTEVSSWNITQVETLSALMTQQLENTTVKSIVLRYLQLGGILNAVSLKAIGGVNLCTLDEKQLLTISNLTDAGALDLSVCTQSKKNLLYSQALSVLSSQQSNPIPYFQLIKAYVGGAPADDLKSLADNRVNMDFETFKGLDPDEVKKLSSQNLIDLLGFNLQALQRGANETVVIIWVASHNESEVRRLGLRGGIPDNSSEPQPDDRPGNKTVNETTLCAAVNSSAFNNFLIKVNLTQLCNFNVTDYACAKSDLLLSRLSSDALTGIFQCFIGPDALKRSDQTALTVFVQKLDRTTLNEALDKFNNKTLNTSSIPLMTKITFMKSLWEIVKTIQNLTNADILRKWFQERFRPFIGGISQSALSNLLMRNITCDGYQAVLKGLSNGFMDMPRGTRESVLRVWIFGYLNITAFPLRCYANNSFVLYVKSYFQRFSELLTLKDAFSLLPSNRVIEVLNATDPSDLADELSRPGFINDNNILTRVLLHIQPIQNLAAFVDEFNQKSRESNLSAANRAAIIEGLWPQFAKSLSVLKDTEVVKWLNVRLTPYLPFITTRLLSSNSTLRVECLSYRKIVKTLSARYSDYTSDKQKEVYNGIKAYLQQGPKPKCYNVNDPALNSTAWFAQYLGLYMNQMSLTDLQSFSDNETQLQEFVVNPENLALLENLTLSTEISKFYLKLLLKSNPNMNVSSLPNSLVCFITDTNLLQSLTAQQILSVTRKINQVCGLNVLPNTTGNGTSPAEGPTDEQLKLSIAIVSKIEIFSVSTLNTLGQTAVGLSVSQVGNIDGDTVQKALPSLSKVRGWNVGQANAIVVKLLRNGLQVNNAQNLLGLGSLVSGIPSGVFQSIDPRVFIRLISNSTFVENIGAASQPLQLIYVLQVLRNVNDPLATVKNIPPVLAKEIPPIMLNSNLSLNDVNNKQWVPSQAAVFFENVVRNSNNFKKFSPSVLQGFSCGAVKTLNSTTFLQLVQSMKGKGVVLDESQLECMSARLNSDGASLAIDTFPVDVLLFFSSAQFRRSDNCQTYFKLVGKSNIDILRKGSARRQNLFNDARTCLEISGRNLTKESVTILGRLVCDLDESIITESDISILDALKYCTSYREDQKKAIELRLNSLSSKYGDPSSWSSSTIKDLGNLALTLNGTWQQVNRDVLNEALPRFIKELKRLRPPSDVLIFINQLNLRRRSNNTANCTEAPIAAEDINDLTPAVYDAAQLDLCLRDLVLKDNVLQLGSLAFDPTQLKVLKKRLLQIYPGGLPENQIQLLGNISTVFNVTEVSSWNITQVETLSALMTQQLENTTVKSIVLRYLQLGGILNAVSLKAIGGVNLCTLDEKQLLTISNLTDAGALDLSVCTQSKKNLLYSQALSVLSSQQSNPIPYFQLIKAYVGGAPADDLKSLADNRVNMDFETFKGLDPDEVKKLSSQNLIDLLGFNLQALQRGANETVVIIWVASHNESEVRRLGLRGGIPDNSSEPQPDDRPGNKTVNETTLCAAVNSSAFNNFLIKVNLTQLCNFNVTDYACAKSDLLLSRLSSDALTGIFQCFIGPDALKRSDQTALTVFVQKLDRTTLNEALDKFNNKTLNTSSIPLMTKITFMKSLWEIVKTIQNLTNADILRKWFKERFRPFIAGISQSALSNLLMRNITCDGYQAVIKGLNNGFREMPRGTRESVLSVWILGYLNTTGAGCISNTNGSRDWLLKNWGMFSQLVQIEDLTRLNPDFSALNAAELLTPSQLGDFAGKNGTLTNADDVQKVFTSITSATVTEFIDSFRNAANQDNVVFAPDVRSVLLREVLNRTLPILSSASSTELQFWFGTRLKILLTGLTENLVPLIFVTESCNGSQIIVSTLSSIKQQLTSSVQEAIYRNILAYSKAIPLRCYENNSFSLYLNSQFENFSEFLTLSDVSSLVPPNRTVEVFNAADPSDFADLFSRPGFIDDNNILIMVLMNYQTIQDLATFVDQFNQKTQDDNLTDANRAAMMEGLWPQFVNSLPELRDTEQDKWLNSRLMPYLSFITTDLLASNNTLRVPCLPYRKIVQTLSARYSNFISDKQKEIYSGINDYLQQDPKPKCYNVTDPVLNSTAWFAQYLGLFMNNVAASDLQKFTDNGTILQAFAANPENLALLDNLTLPSEISKLYIDFLLNNNPNVDTSSIPDSLICFTAGTAVFQSLNGGQALSVIERVNQVCEFTSSDAVDDTLSETTAEQIELSKSLVIKIDSFSASTLNSLQQTAVGLSVSQIEETDPNNFKEALPSLGNVTGWTVVQTKKIVAKLSSTGFEFSSTENLVSLGTLVPGIPSSAFESIESTVLASATSNPTFVRNILEAPQPSQQIIVLKVLQTETNPSRAVKMIPGELVGEIPSVLLTNDLNLNDVNNKSWVPSQAAVFFQNIATNNEDYKIFSASVLQGFSCGAVKDLDSTTFLQLVQAMKGKGAVFDESQLSCMSYRLTSNGTPSAIDTFPEDLLLFFDSTEFRRSPNCKRYFKAVGKSNFNILRKGSGRRQKLLNDALTCLGIAGGNLTKESITVLGDLTCDLEGSIIANCDISILDPLRNCISYSEDQKTAIEFLINNKPNRFGLPNLWSSRTVDDLGNLPLALGSTWNQVNLRVFNQAVPKYIRKLKRVTKAKTVVKFLKQLRARKRSKRAADCAVGQITAEAINELTPVNYDAAQLEACLSNATLKDNVQLLGTLDFDSDQLQVLKNKLNQIYPNGLPEDQIQLLGNTSTVFNATEVSRWNITQVETLSALMMQQLENTTVKAIITRYLELGGTLNAVSLKAIGGLNLCTLDESQLMTISNLTNAGALDISTCTQSKKNLLYSQAFSELISQQNNTISYFNLIKSYLDGGKADDLKTFANNKVNMDFATFIKLNPEEVTKLSAEQLKNLLGVYLPALQTGANETVVLAWVSSHFQSEVRSIGLTGGIPDPSTDPQLNFMCGNTTFNETALCAAVNRSTMNSFLMSLNESQFCNFNITDYACAQSNLLTGLTSDHLTSIFNCFTTAKALNKPDETALGVFIQKLDKIILNEALDKFNNKSTSSIPLITKITFMNALWEIVKTNENLTSSAFLTKWFQERFRPFIAGISQSVLNCLLTRNITCKGYQAVIKGLNNEFREIPQATKETVLKVWILTYLNTTGAGCISNTNGSRDWLLLNWGMFSQLVQIKDLTRLNSNFSGFDVLELLTLRQLSELTVNFDALSNTGNINKILDTLANRSFSELTIYMNHFVNDTQTMDISVIRNTAVRDMMLGKILQQLGPQFPTFKTTDYVDWFQTNLLLLLPSITASELALIPTNIPCESNQAIIKGLDKVYPSLTTVQINNVSELVLNYLSNQLKSSGSACTVNTTGSQDWILKNFGRFRSQAPYSKLVFLNSNFTGVDVAELLTVRQLAQLSASNGTLKDSDDVQKVMSNITADSITQFMDIFSFEAKQNNVALVPKVRSALLSEVLNRAEPIISSSNETELQTWLGTRLQLLIPGLNGNLTQLILTNASCNGAQIIIRTLNARFFEFTTNIQEQLYKSIRTYLRKGPKPRCYNASDSALNSTAWFANYFGKFLIYTSTNDLAMLTDSATLQIFAANQENLNLLKNLTLSEDIQRFYANALFKNEAIDVSSIPDDLVCFVVGTPLLQSLNEQQIKTLLEKANKACQTPSTNGTAPTDEQIQLAVALVSEIKIIPASILNSLGQSAVGLSITQISSINGSDILKSLDNLGKVKGWTSGKGNVFIKKLISTNFQINNASNLLRMGTLVIGLSSEEVENINSDVIISVTNDTTFVENILLAPEPVQVLVVQKIIESSSDPIAAVPDKLATKIPLPRLVSKKITLNLVNRKKWNPNQASVFFGTLIGNSSINFDDISASVLQGFSCTAGNNLNSEQFQKFVKATKGKASLSHDQLLCMARRLNSNGTQGNISALPEDVLLFYDPETFSSENCTDFYRSIGRANINILPQGSERRKNLLANAKKCLKLSNKSLSKDDVAILNNLTCDYDGDITKADISILEALKNCAEYTSAQQNAINTVLNSENSTFGPPSIWTASTLTDLDTLVFAVNTSTWNEVNKAVILEGLRPYVRKQSRFQIQKQRNLLSRLFLTARSKRATGCTIGQITAAMTFDAMLPAQYGTAELEACLDNNVLKDQLSQLGNLAFSLEQLKVIKNKLNQIYPNGLPEEKIQLLGFIAVVYNSTEISSWNITKLETISAVLPNSQNDNTSKAIILRYLTTSGMLNATALNVIGGRVLCLLDESQLQTISPTDISNATPLDISSCSQSKKNIIYNKAKSIIEKQNSDSVTYYNQMKTYLGGATTAQIQTLAANNINMDPGVFLALNPEELKELSPDELKNLLGVNLQTVKDAENSALVRAWISQHTESEVRSLGIGLTGGKTDPVPVGIITIQEIDSSSSSINKNCLLRTIQSLSISAILIVLQRWL